MREIFLFPTILFTGRAKRVVFLPSEYRVRSSLFRAYLLSQALNKIGWRSIVIPPQLGLMQRNRVLRAYRPDVVIVQKCRHPLNKLEFLADYRLVLDIDDADYLDPKLTVQMEAIARQSIGVIAGSRNVAAWAKQFNSNVAVIWTGSKPSDGKKNPHADREKIVTWAQAEPLRYQAEFSFVREVVLSAWRQGSRFKFRLYGWTQESGHESLKPFREMGIVVETLRPMRYDLFLASLQNVAVGLSFAGFGGGNSYSMGKSFGKILAYLDAKVPVICNDAADHSLFFDENCGIIANNIEDCAKKLHELIDNPGLRQNISDLAFERFREQLSISAAAERTSFFLQSSLGYDVDA